MTDTTPRCACCDQRLSGAEGIIWCHRCLRRKRWEYAMSMEDSAPAAHDQNVIVERNVAQEGGEG